MTKLEFVDNNALVAVEKAIPGKPMPRFPLNTDNLLGCREIRFADRQESNYPTLMRLCMDFDFRVLQLQQRIYSHISLRFVPAPAEFVLANCDYLTDGITAMAPPASSLAKLENYVIDNQVDILHDYLFGFGDDTADSGR
jgi:hypothetical protein